MAFLKIKCLARFMASSFAVLLCACGGSGGSDEQGQGFLDGRSSSSKAPISQRPNPHPLAEKWKQNHFDSATNFMALCENPRRGTNPVTGIPYADKAGTLTDEKFYIRSLVHETYLWYDEVIDRNPASYTTAPDYFSVLKTNQLTPSGKPKDSYHFSTDTRTSELIHSGDSVESHGLHYIVDAIDSWGINFRVKYVERQSPAEQAGIKRGDRVLSVDSLALNSALSDADIERIDAALFAPSASRNVRLTLRRTDGGEYSVTIKGANVTPTVVDKLQVFVEGENKVGYLLFNAFSAAAEKNLHDAFESLAAQAADQLILDLRYNGGGYSAISSQLGFMIAGAAQTTDKVFSRTNFNNKHPTHDPFTGEPLVDEPFYSTGLGLTLDSATPLPALNLSRVFVITSPETCSASELVINGLRGIGVEVIQIGSPTCGKPYGYYALDNCGTTYYFVQMKTQNAVGFGDYIDGFSPNWVDDGKAQIKGCFELDDLNHELGDRNEAGLSHALHYVQQGQCKLNSLQRAASSNPVVPSTAAPSKVLRAIRHPAETVTIINRP